MSRENVALFSKAIAKDPALNARISSAATTTDAWVQIAREAGFDFTSHEFAEVVSETLGRRVTPPDAVKEYLGARYTADAELGDRALEAVAGGALKLGSGLGGKPLHYTNL
jgi:predicted ribosomally synthesized peptide with nif11-like leader